MSAATPAFLSAIKSRGDAPPSSGLGQRTFSSLPKTPKINNQSPNNSTASTTSTAGKVATPPPPAAAPKHLPAAPAADAGPSPTAKALMAGLKSGAVKFKEATVSNNVPDDTSSKEKPAAAVDQKPEGPSPAAKALMAGLKSGVVKVVQPTVSSVKDEAPAEVVKKQGEVATAAQPIKQQVQEAAQSVKQKIETTAQRGEQAENSIKKAAEDSRKKAEESIQKAEDDMAVTVKKVKSEVAEPRKTEVNPSISKAVSEPPKVAATKKKGFSFNFKWLTKLFRRPSKK